jgi:hypothetical protein
MEVSIDFAIKYQTARDRVLGELQSLEWISWKVLRRIGGVRYSARLLELRRLGYKIEDAPDQSDHGKRYRLIDPVPSRPQRKQVKLYLPEADVEALLKGHVTLFTISAARIALRIFRVNKHKL